jgi:ribosomal protein S18 acetylase RimI-like enzyme
LTFEIQTASWRDLNGLRQLEQVCFEKDAWPLLDLVAVLTFASIIRLKAVADGKMVGFIAGDPQRAEGIGWITTLGVLPHYRRQGIARSLLVKCEERLYLPRIRLSVRISNSAAILLYQSLGYHKIAVWQRYYIDHEDALVLEKVL